MQTLHYKEATLAHAGIYNSSSGTDIANLAQAHTKSQTLLLLEHQAHLTAMQQQLADLTATNLQLRPTQAPAEAPPSPKTITIITQTFAGTTVDDKYLVDLLQ